MLTAPRAGPALVEVVGDWPHGLQAAVFDSSGVPVRQRDGSRAPFVLQNNQPRFRELALNARDGDSFRLVVAGRGAYNLRFRMVD